MSAEKQRKIKTLEEWKESGKDWDRFCEPGDLVGEDVYWHFLEALPPRSMGYGYLQMGEPHDSRLNPKTGKSASTYMTFVSSILTVFSSMTEILLNSPTLQYTVLSITMFSSIPRSRINTIKRFPFFYQSHYPSSCNYC